ncbi:MAG: hypothetical protein ACRDKB_06040 [Actinomycetota bacterium]
MGFIQKLQDWNQQRASERAIKEHERAVERARQELQLWREERAELEEMIQVARQFRGLPNSEAGVAFNAKKGELIYLVGHGAALIETRRTRGSYQGGYSGFSFRIAKGIRYHAGGTRGQYVPGPEVPTPIDSGTVVITNQRVVFFGPKHSREWAFTKLLAVDHDEQHPWTSLAVSNRQKVSGILYDNENAETFRFRLALALATFNSDVERFALSLSEQLREHESTKPALPPSPPALPS